MPERKQASRVARQKLNTPAKFCRYLAEGVMFKTNSHPFYFEEKQEQKSHV